MVEVQEETTERETLVTQPIVIDLGKQKPKQLRRLMRGQGKLWDEVVDVIEEVNSRLGDDAEGKTMVPIIMVYRRKRKRRRRVSPLFPLS